MMTEISKAEQQAPTSHFLFPQHHKLPIFVKACLRFYDSYR